jgi:hypothetical protein
MLLGAGAFAASLAAFQDDALAGNYTASGISSNPTPIRAFSGQLSAIG